jgi:DNA-binding transcriptional MerR regulator
MKPRTKLRTSGEAARRMGVSADMVRYLARTGRLRIAVQTDSGIRLYRDIDIDRCAAERRKRSAGVAV